MVVESWNKMSLLSFLKEKTKGFSILLRSAKECLNFL